jgi:hypothetical protein
MDPARHNSEAQSSAEIIDFEEGVLDACPAELREELEAEAELLGSALPRDGRARELRKMAQAISAEGPDRQMDAGRARRLAAALRRLAKRFER